MRYITSLILVVSAPILCLLTLIGLFAITLPVYHSIIVSWPDQTLTSEPLKIVTTVTTHLIFGSPLASKYFTLREQLHLQDLRRFIWHSEGLFFVLILMTGLSTAYLVITDPSLLRRTIRWALGWSIIVVGGLTSAMVMKFSTLFELFHRLTFKNDYWQLDPQTEILINLFPPELFYLLSLAILALYFSSAVAWLIILSHQKR